MSVATLDSIVFLRRRSPDWRALARDWRAGRPIAPARFVPDRPVPGFPPDVAALIDIWNAQFAIDFFTTRAILAELSRASVAAVAGGLAFTASDLAGVSRLAQTRQFVAFFHDDDDLFAPDLLRMLAHGDVWAHDTCVFPLYRVHADLFTFVRPGMMPAVLLGRAKPFDFRFQSNNYGVSSRICDTAILGGLEDHVLGSAFADRHRLTEAVLPFAVSATVKTPAAASQLALLASPETRDAAFRAFIERIERPDCSAALAWLAAPLVSVARLMRAVHEGRGHDAVADLLAPA